MKLISLIGSLLISAVPVQAFETIEELKEACDASEENGNLCTGVAELGVGMSMVTVLCHLEEKGRITTENLDLTWDDWYEHSNPSPMSNEAVEWTLKKYPECSIKPIP
ncbi:hypothetical protein [Synechococcus sp. MIT S1220]|uniref:hypothetical protein n=1 Tax=Synechococcus sp. MIT S1220 TaxID=3082549 RepID=UPI0039B0FE9C